MVQTARNHTEKKALTDVWGLITRVGLSRFEELARLARRAPTTTDELALVNLAQAESPDMEYIGQVLAKLDSTIDQAIEPFKQPIQDFHSFTDPHMWEEALLKHSLNARIWEGFISSEKIHFPQDLIKYLSQTKINSKLAKYPIQSLHRCLDADSNLVGRLSLYGRRVVGEFAIQAETVFALNPELANYLAGQLEDELAALKILSKELSARIEDGWELMNSFGLQT